MVSVQSEGLWDRLFQLELNLTRILARREAGAVADPEDVRIDRERLFIEGGVEDDIGGLSADARQFLQLFASAWDLAPMIADQCLRQGDDVLRLRVEQPDRLDRLAQPFLAQRDHLLGRFHALEQRPGRDIDARVGRLRRQHHGDEQSIRIGVFQLGCWGWILLGQSAEEFEYLRAVHRLSTTSRIE